MGGFGDGLIVIPARYDSCRLPGKPLMNIAGKTMIRRTYERAVLSGMSAIVVTNDDRIANECREHSIPIEMITEPCVTGTDRVARYAQRSNKKWFINVQGDEPFANPIDIESIAKQMITSAHCDEVVNGMTKITNPNDLYNVSIPKVIVRNEELLYMTRAPVPYPFGSKDYYGHQQVCIYGYSKEQLEKFLNQSEKTFYENIEDIEMLRFHEMGIRIRMLELEGSPLHVDTENDLSRAQLIAKDFDDLEESVDIG